MVKTDGTFENGIGLITNIFRLLREGVTCVKVSAATKCSFRQLKLQIITLFNKFKYLDGLGHDFRADAVSGQNGDFVVFHKIDFVTGDRLRSVPNMYAVVNKSDYYSGGGRWIIQAAGTN